MIQAEFKTEPDKLAIKDLKQLFTEHFPSKTNVNKNGSEFFWTIEAETDISQHFWWRLIEFGRECNFERVTPEELLIWKFMTANTYKNLRNKLMKQKKPK